MKLHTFAAITSSLLLVLLMGACRSENSYSNKLKAEKALIASFTSGFRIIPEAPAYGTEWGENDYIRLFEDCYFHLSKAGDTTQLVDGEWVPADTIAPGRKVLVRFLQYTLEKPGQADTIFFNSTLTSSSPVSLEYQDLSKMNTTQIGYMGLQYPAGWYLAMPYLRCSGAEGKLVCPSKLGTQAASGSVTPYGYDLRIQLQNF